MTTFTKITASLKNQKLDFVNCMVSVHNLKCECERPLSHIVESILEQEPELQYSKCRPTTATGPPEDDDEDAFGKGDLDLLFAQDFGDTTDAATTTNTG